MPLSQFKQYSLAYWCFLMLGVGILFPWNCFLTASTYFAGIYTGFAFEFAISLAYNYPNLVVLLLSVKYGPSFSFTSRIVSTFSIVVAVLVIVPISVSFMSKSISLWVILIGVFITGSKKRIFLFSDC